jgi:hypothetical protein
MSIKALVCALVLATSAAAPAIAQNPPTEVAVPEISWKLGTLRGTILPKGTGADYLFQYTVVVPEGTAGSYTVQIELCTYEPVKTGIPDVVTNCVSSEQIPIETLGVVEEGRVYEGGIRYGYDPSSVTKKRINRFSYTLKLRQIDGPDPSRVIAEQQFNDIVFYGFKNPNKEALGLVEN